MGSTYALMDQYTNTIGSQLDQARMALTTTVQHNTLTSEKEMLRKL